MAFIILLLLFKVIEWSGIAAWEKRILGYNFVSTALVYFGLPIALIKLRRNKTASYGLDFSNYKNNFKIGLSLLTIYLPLTVIGFGILSVLGLSYRHLYGALILGGMEIIALLITHFLFAKMLRARRINAKHVRAVTLLLLILSIATVFSWLAKFVGVNIGVVIFPIFFIGLGEEMFFRGYIQSRVNESFQKSWEVRNVHINTGIIVASLIFAAAHPIAAHDISAWPWSIWIFCSGIFLGYVKERTGSIIAPSILHGVTNSIGFVIGSIGR